MLHLYVDQINRRNAKGLPPSCMDGIDMHNSRFGLRDVHVSSEVEFLLMRNKSLNTCIRTRKFS